MVVLGLYLKYTTKIVDEFTVYRLIIMALTEQQKSKLQVGFNSLDFDRSGFLSAEDYVEKAKSLAMLKGYEVGSSEHNAIESQLLEIWGKVQQAVDSNGDQKVTLEEFLNFADNAGTSLIEDVFVKTTDMVFDLADTNGDGKINFNESKSFFLLFESNLGAASESFSQIDTNNIGEITKEQTREMVRSAFS